MMKARLQKVTSGEGRTQDRHDVYFALIAALVSLAAYLAVLPTGYALGDGPELATAAWTLGVPHPPGYPIFTQLGHLAGAAAGDALEGLRFLCLISVCASTALAYLILRRLIHRRVLALAGSLILAGSFLFVHNALYVEVYATALLGMLVSLWALSRAILEEPEPRKLLSLALIYGLVLGHHLTLLALAPVFIYAVIRYGRLRRPPWGFYALCAALFALGLSVFLYLPLRSAATAQIAWFRPDRFERLLFVLSGANYGEYWGITGAQFWSKALQLVEYLFHQLPLGLILAAPLGLAMLWRRNRYLTLGLILVIVFDFYWAASYAVIGLEVFLLPAAVLLLFSSALALVRVGELLLKRLSGKPAERRLRWAAFLPALIVLGYGVINYNKPEDLNVRPHAGNLLRGAPPESAVLIGGDLSFPLLEAQFGRDRRPDLLTADEGGYILHPRLGSLVRDRISHGAPLYHTDPPAHQLPLAESRSGVGYLYRASPRPTQPSLEPVTGGGVYAAETAIRYLIARLESSPPQERKQVWAALAPMAFELAGESSHAHLALGIHWLDDDPELAESFFRRAVELDPWMPSARLDLALALAAQGCEDEAARELEAALAGFGEEEVKNDARRLLNSINTD